MFSYFEPNFLEKFLWESSFSNFGQLREIKIGYLAAILQQYNILKFLFCKTIIFCSAYTYGANFIAKFRWESSFLQLGP